MSLLPRHSGSQAQDQETEKIGKAQQWALEQ
jgi:hypothetical protein